MAPPTLRARSVGCRAGRGQPFVPFGALLQPSVKLLQLQLQQLFLLASGVLPAGRQHLPRALCYRGRACKRVRRGARRAAQQFPRRRRQRQQAARSGRLCCSDALHLHVQRAQPQHQQAVSVHLKSRPQQWRGVQRAVRVVQPSICTAGTAVTGGRRGSGPIERQRRDDPGNEADQGDARHDAGNRPAQVVAVPASRGGAG
mmetsp:Transcript_12957/g.37608  ORF Transcript_12957/g.37608 Transcript_12957/m.37608 type:complete len:201 (+) Transcript_12957:654-1256(+)